MEKIQIVKINIGQSVIVNETGTAIGVCNSEKKAIALCVPYTVDMLELPVEMKQFSVERVHHLEVYVYNAQDETVYF